MPVVRSAEDEERVRSNPRISVEDGEAVRKFSDNINAVAAQANSSARIAYGEEALDSVQIQGVSRDYIYFSTFSVDRKSAGCPTPAICANRHCGHGRGNAHCGLSQNRRWR